MHELFRRVAIHGTITALLLGIIGVVLAEMASATMLTPTGGRSGVNGKQEADPSAVAQAARMKTNVPLAMAAWGFGFIVLVEAVRHVMRRRRPIEPVAKRPPDETEKLLEELLNQAEAKAAATSPTPQPAVSEPGAAK